MHFWWDCPSDIVFLLSSSEQEVHGIEIFVPLLLMFVVVTCVRWCLSGFPSGINKHLLRRCFGITWVSHLIRLFRSSFGIHWFLTATVNVVFAKWFFLLHHATFTYTELFFLHWKLYLFIYFYHYRFLDFKITQDSINLYYNLLWYSNYATVRFIQFI